MTHRLPVIGVMGSGADEAEPRATSVGRLLASLPVHLLTGGGCGVMRSVSRAFVSVPERQGRVVGVVPCRPEDPAQPRRGYPNPFVEIVIRTHLPLSGAQGTDAMSRNHINVLSSDAILVLPGGAGTLSEVRLATRYGRPIFGVLEASEMRGLAHIERSICLDDVERFIRREVLDP